MKALVGGWELQNLTLLFFFFLLSNTNDKALYFNSA